MYEIASLNHTELQTDSRLSVCWVEGRNLTESGQRLGPKLDLPFHWYWDDKFVARCC